MRYFIHASILYFLMLGLILTIGTANAQSSSSKQIEIDENWIGMVFLYTFGGDILYGMKHQLFIDEYECSNHYESLENWEYAGKHTNMFKMPPHMIQYETPMGNVWVLCEKLDK